MKTRLWFLVGAMGALAAAEACSGDSSTTDGGTDGSPADSTVQDTGGNKDSGMQMDTGTGNDTGGNDTGTGSDASDGGGPPGLQYQCMSADGGKSLVTSCAMCTGRTQPCLYCGVMDASVLDGICNVQGTACVTNLSGFQACTCASATDCPGAFQVCQGGGKKSCQTCGDNGGTNGMTCKSGGTCDAMDGGC